MAFALIYPPALVSLERRERSAQPVPKRRAFCRAFFVLFSALATASASSVLARGHSEPKNPAPAEQCRIVPGAHLPAIRPGLSPLWDREYTGLDLADSLLKSEETDGKIRLASVPIALADSNIAYDEIPTNRLADDLKRAPVGDRFEQFHGTPIANYLFANDKLRTNQPAVLAEHVLIEQRDYSSEERARLWNQILETRSRLLSRSNLDPDDKTTREAAQKLTTQDRIVIQAAGNSDPREVAYYRHPDFIHVGSLSPLGVLSDFSSSFDGVTVLAPADRYQLTRFGARGGFYAFKGTSAATPVVTAATANLLAFVPKLSARWTKYFVFHTAIATIANEPRDKVPGLPNGLGMLNAYKLARLGKRLAERCPEERQRDVCVRKFLDDRLNREALLNFGDEAKAKLDEARQLAQPAATCQARQDAFRLLRESFFLAPSSEAAKLIASVYREQGFPVNATFYDSLTMKRRDFIRHAVFSSGIDFSDPVSYGDWKSLDRTAKENNLDLEALVKAALASPEGDVRARAVTALPLLGKRTALAKIDELRKSDAHPSVQLALLGTLLNPAATNGYQDFRSRFDPDDSTTRDVAYEYLRRSSDDEEQSWNASRLLGPLLTEAKNPDNRDDTERFLEVLEKKLKRNPRPRNNSWEATLFEYRTLVKLQNNPDKVDETLFREIFSREFATTVQARAKEELSRRPFSDALKLCESLANDPSVRSFGFLSVLEALGKQLAANRLTAEQRARVGAILALAAQNKSNEVKQFGKQLERHLSQPR